MAGKIRSVLKFCLTLCLIILFYAPVLAAEGPTFRIDMDTLNLQKGVSANIVISLVNAQNAQIVNIEGFENFDVLSQSQSSYTSIVNNQVSYQIDLYYTIMPKNIGEFTLKANIKYNEQDYETNSLQVTVNESSNNTGQAASDLFVKTNISHEEAYLGERIIVTYELYSRYNIDSFGLTDYSVIDGVIAKEMPSDQLRAEYVYIDGNRYVMYEVKQLIIDPIKSGVCVIPSFNLQVNVITDNGFGGIFRSSTPMYLQTERKELTIRPLPSDGRPDDFSGIVGELNLEGHYSRTEMNYGDSFSLQAKISGSCNIDALKSITASGLIGFSVYETQKNTIESVENNKYYVQKEFDIILVPERTGILDVSPVSISYFNPVTEKYERAEIPGISVEVFGDMSLTSTSGESMAIETIEINQVNYTETNDGYFSINIKKEHVYTALIVIAGISVLIVCLIFIVVGRKKQDKALKSIYKQLVRAKDVNEIYNLFNGITKHCFNLNLKACSQNTVRERLSDTSLVEQITDIMDCMESSKSSGEELKDKIKRAYRKILSC